ncbi:hypothetical protein sS8_4041 [Methylocaldum marinum]|uniref:Uncharacterized protein n=1 Tax=Methylocaldum marinum TaxID=1432792 RepID=A0A250KWK5_9GAMM|nr:hypothetical protein [Methylocaldum marinum]BBA35972.1 hypothetical protein sS8_4041 [Methylocaldum marinum]
MQHDPALPFKLDIESAAVWMDGLSVTNTRECCRVLYPALRSLNGSSVEPRLRFTILERCRLTVTRLEKGLVPYFLDKPFPLDGKTRKIASLCSRFHSELASGYRQVVEAETFAETFDAHEQALIFRRAFESYASCLLRTAQIYEAHPLSSWSSVFDLFQLAEQRGLSNAVQSYEISGAVSVALFFKVILLFGIAVPGTLGQRDMQRLYDFLVARAESVKIESSPVSNGTRAVLSFDLTVAGTIMPVPAPAPVDKPGLRFLFMDRLLNELRGEIRMHGKPEENPLTLILPRLGGRLPHQPELTARSAAVSFGIDAIAITVRLVERRRVGGAARDPWSNLEQLELAPLSTESRSEILGSKSTGTFAAALVSGAGGKDDSPGTGFRDMRSVKVYRSELPGFYIVDSGGQVFRVGDLISLNTDDEIIQVGVVRGGQIHNGQFCYSVELIGNQPCSVLFLGEPPGGRPQNALMFLGSGGLVIPSVKLRGGDTIFVEQRNAKKAFRVAKVLESNGNFCHVALTTAEEPASFG